MTESERIEAREIDGLAWAIRSTVHQAAYRRERPSAYVAGILDAMQRRAGFDLANVIRSQGLELFRHDGPHRAHLAELLREVSEDQARAIRTHCPATPTQPATESRQGGFLALAATYLAKIREGTSTARKSAPATNPPESPYKVQLRLPL